MTSFSSPNSSISFQTRSMHIIGFVFFGSLFCLAWIFFKERMLAVDPAFFSFRIIQDKSYDIELHRWGSVVSQIIPLMLLKSNCTLETFLKAYSVSFIIIYYLLFLIITVGLKNYRAGYALMITLCLVFRHCFYYPTAELYQGMSICILIWALIVKLKESESKKLKIFLFIIICLLIYVVSYYHQLTLFAVLFILLFEILNEKKFKDEWLIGLLIFVVAWFYIRIKILTVTDYESGKIPTLAVFREQLSNLKHLPSYVFLKQFTKTSLLPFIVVMAVNIFLVLKRKKVLLFFFITSFIACFLILDIITYYKGESTIMYENYLTLLGLFAAVTFYGLIKNFMTRWVIVFSLIMLIWNVNAIYASHYPFSCRIDYLKRLTDEGHKYPEKKYLIDQANFPSIYAWTDWALPFETLLYSSLQGPDSSITFRDAVSYHQFDSIMNNENIFLGPPWAITWFWTNGMNQNYFHLPANGYRKLASLQSDSTFRESAFNNKNVFILQHRDMAFASNEKYTVIPIRIKNNSGKIIHSISDSSHPISLSYHVSDENGTMVLPDGNRTPLEMDIDKVSDIGLVVKNELKKGNYIVTVDFVTENVRWWNINSKIRFKIK
jgi:hypothetical protein